MRNALLFLQKLEEAFPRKVLRERHALMVIDNEGNPALQVCLGGYLISSAEAPASAPARRRPR